MFVNLFEAVGPLWTGGMLLVVVGVVAAAPLAHVVRLHLTDRSPR